MRSISLDPYHPRTVSRFPESFRKMLTSFLVFVNGFEPSKRGEQMSWTSIGPEDLASIASIPKFCQYFEKINLIMFDRLPRSWRSL
jgi:hypothetical protein